MVILFVEQRDKAVWNIRRDNDRSAFEERPVILEYLISDPYDPVCLIVGIARVQSELLAEIKEEDFRIGLYVIIRKSDDNALCIVF